MKQPNETQTHQKAATLLEMTIVILVLLSLIGAVGFSTKKISEWKLGREAGETLRLVYTAQRQLLADQPTKPVSDIEGSDLLPYLNNYSAIPTIEDLNGDQLPINFNVSPPVVGTGETPYDPSGKDSDSLWDVGQ